MTTQTLIETVYAAFNARDTEGALALMHEDVSWPKASEGGRVMGREEVRSYWTRQWAEFDPHVEPKEVTENGESRVDVKVHQVVRSLRGEVLSDSEVRHVYAIRGGLIERMDIGGSEHEAEPAIAAAFIRR